MSSESVCQVARSWVDVGSFYTRLFGVVPLTCGDFHDGSERGTAFSPASFWRKTKLLLSPTHRFGTLWLLPISKTEIEAIRTPVWYQWGDRGRIGESAWHSDRKGLPGSVPKMEETVGPVSTCGRELLRRWRRPIGLMVSFTIFTASVRKILDQPMYIPPGLIARSQYNGHTVFLTINAMNSENVPKQD